MKITTFSAIALSGLFLAACQPKQELKDQILDKVDQVEQKVDQQLLDELNSDSDASFDSDFAEFEKELK